MPHVGSRLEELQAGFGASLLPAGARYAQIDTDPFAIARNVVPDIPARRVTQALALEEVAELLAARGASAEPRAAWRATIAELRRSRRRRWRWRAPTSAARCSAASWWEIERVFGPNTILAHETAATTCGRTTRRTTGCSRRHLDPARRADRDGHRRVGAIGAKLARPDLHVVCTTGDGAMQMALGELGSAVLHRAPVTWVVFADGGFGWVQFLQRESGLPIKATDFGHRTDFVASARAQGAHGERVEHGAELAAALDRARRANDDGVPALVEVEVARHEYAPGFVSSTATSGACGPGSAPEVARRRSVRPAASSTG